MYIIERWADCISQSGVTYELFGRTDYDDNSSGCMRLNHAYGVQMKNSWPAGGKTPYFTFEACSGAHLEDMARGTRQMDRLHEDTRLVTMQAGGNDAGFYALARDCIFHNEDKDYGPDYPDPAGACYKSIEWTRNFIRAGHTDVGIWRYMDDTIRDVLEHPRANDRNDFKLYVVEYAHLFNDMAGESDFCNDISFSVSLNERLNGNTPKLSRELRQEINSLTTEMNGQILDVVRWRNGDSEEGKEKVVVVPITEHFNEHRFCDKDQNANDQWYGEKVYFWNASPEGLIGATEDASEASLQDMADASWQRAYNTSEPEEDALKNFVWNDLLQVEKGPEALSPHQGWSPGFALRPFHPKALGHTAIRNALMPLIDRDFGLAEVPDIVCDAGLLLTDPDLCN